MENEFKITFLGTNGSCAYNNGSRTKYGSNTLCIAINAGGHNIVLDAGTGICGLNYYELLNEDTIHLLFSHYHLDHISGLMFYNGIFDPKIKLNLYDAALKGASLYDALTTRFNKPFYPLTIDDALAKVTFKNDFMYGDVDLGSGTVIKSYDKITHPGGCRSYRIESQGKSFCYMTDIELASHVGDDALITFCKGADYIVIDSFFSSNEAIKGWGHSSSIECAEFAKMADVGQLVLYHYNQFSTDDDIDCMLQKAKNVFKNTVTSYDGLTICF